MTGHQRCRMQLRVVLRQFIDLNDPIVSLRNNVQGFLEPSIMITSNTYHPVSSLDSTRILRS